MRASVAKVARASAKAAQRVSLATVMSDAMKRKQDTGPTDNGRKKAAKA